MNPQVFYIILSTLILLQLTLIDIYKGKENHAFSPFPPQIHLNFTSVAFYRFEWMMADTSSKGKNSYRSMLITACYQ